MLIDLRNFTVTIRPDEGLYKGGVFPFTFNVSKDYPHEAPKVHCDKTVSALLALLNLLIIFFLIHRYYHCM